MKMFDISEPMHTAYFLREKDARFTNTRLRRLRGRKRRLFNFYRYKRAYNAIQMHARNALYCINTNTSTDGIVLQSRGLNKTWS